MDLFEGEAGHGADKGLGETAQFPADENDRGPAGGEGAGDAQGVGDDGQVGSRGEEAGERENGTAAIEEQGVIGLDPLQGGLSDGLFFGGGDRSFIVENGFREHGVESDGAAVDASDFSLRLELGEITAGGGSGNLEDPAEVIDADDPVFPENVPEFFEAFGRQIALFVFAHIEKTSIKNNQI